MRKVIVLPQICPLTQMKVRGEYYCKDFIETIKIVGVCPYYKREITGKAPDSILVYCSY